MHVQSERDAGTRQYCHFAALPRQLEAQAEQIPLVRNISLIGNLTIKVFVFSLVFMLSWGRCTGSQTWLIKV
jgi:hypothetical protein